MYCWLTPSPCYSSSQHLLGVYVDGLTLDMNMLKRYLELPPMDQLYGELLSVINHPPRLLAQLLQVCWNYSGASLRETLLTAHVTLCGCMRVRVLIYYSIERSHLLQSC